MARMKEMRDAYRVLGRKPEGKNHMEDPGIDGRIILKSLFEKYVGRTWTFESLSSCCESGSEPSRAIKCGELAAEPVSFSRRTLLHGVSK